MNNSETSPPKDFIFNKFCNPAGDAINFFFIDKLTHEFFKCFICSPFALLIADSAKKFSVITSGLKFFPTVLTYKSVSCQFLFLWMHRPISPSTFLGAVFTFTPDFRLLKWLTTSRAYCLPPQQRVDDTCIL